MSLKSFAEVVNWLQTKVSCELSFENALKACTDLFGSQRLEGGLNWLMLILNCGWLAKG